MLKKISSIFVISSLSFISSDAFSSSYVRATPANINVGQSVVIDWSRYYPNKYQNQTYNLYVYKPSDQHKYKYRNLLTGTSDIRGPISMSGLHTIEVEVCDQYGENCFTSSSGRVNIRVNHMCEYKKQSTYGGYSYFCDGNKVTHTIGSNSDPLGAPDKIESFISVKGRVFWKYTENSRTYSNTAWYTNCRSGGQFELVTEKVNNRTSPGSQFGVNRIDNFIAHSSGDKAEWAFYNARMNTSTERTLFLGKCL